MAMAYAREGAKVVAVARSVNELKSLESAVRSRGEEIIAIPVDLSKENEIQNLGDKVLSTYGRFDVLVNNAAVSYWKTVEDMTLQEWDFTMAVNIRSYFLATKAFLPTMKKQHSGSIINISSKSAEQGFVAEIAYCPSKFAMEGLTQCLALELNQYNIAVNSLNVGAPPGKVLKPTNLTLEEAEKMPQEVKQKYADDESMVQAFTDAWTFLAAQDGSGVTGPRFSTRELAAFLAQNGWEKAVANWRKKLTVAVYTPFDMPKVVRYQTPEGGWKELKF
jgi:NAD(P)-dependent dehydrogenase (short-subunit alcohol dehydrogenase family)